MFALSKLLLYHICSTFLLSFFGVCQFLVCHFNGLYFLAPSNSSVVSEAELGISVLVLIVICVTKMDS